MHSLLNFLGLLAAAISMGCALPQVVRLLRSSHADGVSYSASVLGILASGTWLGYGLLIADPAQIVANAPGLLFAVAIMALVVRRTNAPVVPVVAASVGWVGVAAAAFLLAGPTGLGAAGSTVALVTRAPQVRTALKGHSLAGLSPMSLLLSIISASIWTLYGLGSGQAPVVFCSAVGVGLALLLLHRRCPPGRVLFSLYLGRWGAPGQLMVRRLMEIRLT